MVGNLQREAIPHKEGDLASSQGVLRDGDDGPHLSELCLIKISTPPCGQLAVA